MKIEDGGLKMERTHLSENVESPADKLLPSPKLTSEKAAASRDKSWPSPQPLLYRALVLGVLFFLVHLAGLREYTAFLSGTPAMVETSMRLSFFYGSIYILLYLGAVVLAPILVIAAGILALWRNFTAGDGG